LADAAAVIEEYMWIVVGPTLLYGVWGALAVATLGYYYRWRGSCEVCGNGASSEASELLVNYTAGGQML